MCITLTPPSITKIDTMDMSYFVQEDDISIMIPYPTTKAANFQALLEPFQTPVYDIYIFQHYLVLYY